MRLAWPPPWHLTASALLCVIALALANLTPAGWQQRASIPAAVLVALVSGHLVVLSAYPAHGLDMKRRAVLIILASALLAGILSVLLTATPRGLQPSSLATTLSLLSLLLAAVAYGRWSAQPRKRRFRFLSRRGMRPAGARPSGRRAAYCVVIAFLAAAIALLSGLVHIPEMSEGSGADLGSEGVSLQAASPQDSGIDESPAPPEEKSEMSDVAGESVVVAAGGGGSAATAGPSGGSSASAKGSSAAGGSSSSAGSTGATGSTQTAEKKAASTAAAVAASKPEKTATATENAPASSVSAGAAVSPQKAEERPKDQSAVNSSANIGQVTINPSSVSTEGNQPPIIKSLAPDKASPQEQGVPVFWRVEAEDEAGDKTVYQFLVNGAVARKWSKSATWSWSTAGLPAGEYLITVLARDEKHAAEDSFDSKMNATFYVKAANQPPSVLELKADRPSPQSIGSKITWTALASDPDGDGIFYKFAKNGVGVTDWSGSEFWTWDTTSEKSGEYVISVLVRDGKHSSEKSSDGSLESRFTLTASNKPPAVTELQAQPSGPYAAGDVITWICKAADPEEDKILYKFLVNGRVAQDWSESASWSWDTAGQPAAEYTITALARDGKHAGPDSSDSSKAASVTLSRPASASAANSSNRAPALFSLRPDKSSPQVQGETIVWTAEAKDEDADKIFYKFQLNGRDMNRWSESASWKWSTSGLADGDYRIRVLIRDGNHAPESSYDGSLDSKFTLISEIDRQIDELMKKRSGKVL